MQYLSTNCTTLLSKQSEGSGMVLLRVATEWLLFLGKQRTGFLLKDHRVFLCCSAFLKQEFKRTSMEQRLRKGVESGE